VIQSDGKTQTYEFIGHYFYNEATGDGGVWVTGFIAGGQTFDPTQIPGFPASYGQYFGPGTGGVITHDEVQANPACMALIKRPWRNLRAAEPGADAAMRNARRARRPSRPRSGRARCVRASGPG